MNPSEVTNILRQFNEWQRGHNTVLRPSSNELGEAIDAAVEMIERLEAAEKERDNANAAAIGVALQAEALQAKIEAIERQEPVRWGCTVLQVDGSWKEEIGIEEPPKDYFSIRNAFPLYALPGAQLAPSVPEDVMRDAERYRYLRARDDGTAGVGCWIEADGRACDRVWLYGVQLDSAIDSFIEVLAAAPKPEAKP